MRRLWEETYKNPLVARRGIRNIGNTCYLASLFQCLAHCSQINTVGADPLSLLLKQLKKCSVLPVDIRKVWEFICGLHPQYLLMTQWDPIEVFVLLVEFLNVEQFNFKIREWVECKCSPIIRTDVHQCLPVEIRDKLSECLKFRFETENLGEHVCETCKSAKCMKHCVLEETSDILVIQLKRFLWVQGPVKRCEHVEFEEFMTVGSWNFKIKGIIEHIGRSTEHGHYVSYCKLSKKWFKFDDTIVTEVTPSFDKIQAYVLFYKVCFQIRSEI